jgi:hypothetical protein
MIDRRGTSYRLGALATRAAVISTIAFAGTATTTAHAERFSEPVLQQVTGITTGDVANVKLRSETANWITFSATGDVMGSGTETPGREVYLYSTVTGTLTRVTTTTDGESYAPSRVTDSTFAAGRPDSFSFVSTGDLDPDRDNSDHNPEIFIYEVASGEIHQVTDTLPPVVNGAPFSSDSAKCVVFESTADLDNNDGSDDGRKSSGTTSSILSSSHTMATSRR